MNAHSRFCKFNGPKQAKETKPAAVAKADKTGKAKKAEVEKKMERGEAAHTAARKSAKSNNGVGSSSDDGESPKAPASGRETPRRSQTRAGASGDDALFGATAHAGDGDLFGASDPAMAKQTRHRWTGGGMVVVVLV